MSNLSHRLISKLSAVPRKAVFIALLLLFAALSLLYPPLAKQDILLSGAAGDLLYAAAFDGFSDEWDLYAGQQSAQLADAQLELSVNAAQTSTWSTARPLFRDFDLRLQATATAGPLDNGFGIVFRLQRAAENVCQLPAAILCGIEDLVPLFSALIRRALEPAASTSYYAFFISSDGYYSLQKIIGGRTQTISTWIPSPSIQQGLQTQNTIRVLGRGADFEFFINGERARLCIPDDPAAASTYVSGECIGGALQTVYRDATLTDGRIGVIAQATQTGGSGVTVRFDDLLLHQPSDSTGDVRA